LSIQGETVTGGRLMMNPKRLMGLLILIILVVCIFAFGKTPINRNVRSDVLQNPPASRVSEVPEFVIYGFLFKKVSRLSEKTLELRSQGKIGQKPYYPMQKEAALSVAESMALEAIASACQREVDRQDERARIIIQAFRVKFPDGKVPKGTTLPPPPPELITMQEERNAIILRARDQLRVAFGEASFASLDNYVKFRYRPTSGPVSPILVSPESK
jgi:hypothetical protein